MTIPQVYINVSGGIAEGYVTRGKAEIIQVDWDIFDDNVPTADEVLSIYRDLKTIADVTYRKALLINLKEAVNRLTSWNRAERELRKRKEHNRLTEARRILQEAGELP